MNAVQRIWTSDVGEMDFIYKGVAYDVLRTLRGRLRKRTVYIVWCDGQKLAECATLEELAQVKMQDGTAFSEAIASVQDINSFAGYQFLLRFRIACRCADSQKQLRNAGGELVVCSCLYYGCEI